MPKPLASEELLALEKRRAPAYLRMEPVICDISNMATRAMEAVLDDEGASNSKGNEHV